jgi:ribokinase
VSTRVRAACVGHLEWVEFARVDRVPRAGEVIHALDGGEEPAGGGAVAAVQLARLAGQAEFFTALGDDKRGHRSHALLENMGVRVHVAWRDQPTRRALTFVDDDGERTITTLGPRLAPTLDDQLPWERLADMDTVYFTAGDAGALRAARAARILVASPRAGVALDEGVELDALVASLQDAGERGAAERRASTGLLVLTDGANGGAYRSADGAQGSWASAPLPGPRVDSYGCGDSFAAGVAYGLAATGGVAAALALAARCGATCLTGHGPYEHQLTFADL